MMIRSLVAMIHDETEEVTVRRNLEKEELALSIREGQAHLWIDIVDPDPEEIRWLADCMELNPAVVQDLHRQDQRPALLVYPAYVFLSLFQPHLRTKSTDNSEIHCIITDKCFATVRRSESSTVDDAYDRVAQNPDTWRSGVSYFLYLTSQNVIDAYYPLLDRINNQLNTIEEKLLNGDYVADQPRKQVYRIKQQLIRLQQMVSPQREVFSNLIGEKRLTGAPETRDLFRHLYERLLRVYDVIASHRDLSSDILDMMQSREARQLVETVNRLTIFSMIFLPLAFFTGLFELGFATTSDPFELPVSGQVLFIGIIVLMVVSVTTMIVIFKRRNWL